VLAYDLVDVFELDEAIPDGLGIDHDDWTVLALIEASGLVGADYVLEPSLFYGVFEGILELLAVAWKTAGTGCRAVALVGADEEMMFKLRQLRTLRHEPHSGGAMHSSF
jgi:hypothetical protein